MAEGPIRALLYFSPSGGDFSAGFSASFTTGDFGAFRRSIHALLIMDASAMSKLASEWDP